MFSNAKLNELAGWQEVIDREMPHLEYDFQVYMARFDARRAVQTKIAINELAKLRAEYSARMNEIVNAELAALEAETGFWATEYAYQVDCSGALVYQVDAELAEIEREYNALVFDALFVECGNGQFAPDEIEIEVL